jgi:Ni/Fe-hydrogenase subunit HybB-like protein
MAESTTRGAGFLRAVGYAALAAGAVAAAARLLLGLGATTNLNDGYPWGLWISFDVLCGVALAAGGFTISAAVYVFNLEKFRPLLRPAKVSAFVGYTMVVMGLFLDVGMPWRLWHPLVMWNPSSVLFEVAWCVMLYTNVLAVDVVALWCEKRGRETWVRFFRSIYVFLVVAGVVLSTLHQSSLGALYLLAPQKLSPLWASAALGPLFYVSAIVAGLSVVMLEGLLGRHGREDPSKLELHSSLGYGLSVALLVYFAMRVTDLYARDVAILAFSGGNLLLLVELLGTVALPAVLLGFFDDVRRSRRGLVTCAALAAAGVVLNRFAVSLLGYTGHANHTYFPSIAEFAVTAGFIAAAILGFDLFGRYLPVHVGVAKQAKAPPV